MFNFLFEGKIGEYLAPVMPVNQLFLSIQHHKNDEVERIILSGQIDIKSQSEVGYSAIHASCRYNNVYAFNLISSQGVHVETLDSQGNSPLHYASKYGHFDMCKLLVERGCSPAKKNNLNKTPYDVAESHVIRQYLMPLQLQSESASQDGSSIHPGINFGGSPMYMQQPSVHSDSQAYTHTLPPSPQHLQPMGAYPPPPGVQPPPSSVSNEPSYPQANRPPPMTLSIGIPNNNRPTLSSTSNDRIIKPDGFHSSASDPQLQLKYGHVKQVVNIAPPPTTTGSGGVGVGVGINVVPNSPYSMFNNSSSTSQSAYSNTGQPMYNRYVAYDPHTNSVVPPPPPPPVDTQQSPPPGIYNSSHPNTNSPYSTPSPSLSSSNRTAPSISMAPMVTVGSIIPRNINVFNPATDCDVISMDSSSNAIM